MLFPIWCAELDRLGVSGKGSRWAGFGARLRHAVGREEETWRGELACVRDGGPCRPISGPWRSPPRQMPDAARAAVLAAPAASCPFQGAAAALGLQTLLLQLGLRGARGGFRGSKACGYCFLLCKRASCSPGITVSASQSHQEAQRGPWEAPGTVPAHIITWFGCPHARDLGVFQTGWGRDGSLRRGEPTRSREKVSPCRGACVSQTRAHPVTFEWRGGKGEGCVQ